MKKVLQNIWNQFAILYGKYYSLDKKFRKHNAVAIIHFIEGESKEKGSIKLKLGGITYFFEGTPKINKYKNCEGREVLKKELKYGGWELDMTHKDNKLF